MSQSKTSSNKYMVSIFKLAFPRDCKYSEHTLKYEPNFNF